MEFNGGAGIWMSRIWISFFQQKVGKSLMLQLQLPRKVSIIRGVGKSNSRFFKDNRVGFLFAAQMQPFSLRSLHYQKDVERFALGFETQNQAPFDALTSAKAIVWRLNTYSGDWRVPARQ